MLTWAFIVVIVVGGIFGGFSEWMLDNPSVDFCIGLACQWTTVRFGCGKKKISTSQKPCRNSERHNHHRYQIHQILYVYIFHFHGGEGGCTNWDVTWGGNPKCFEAAVILGHDVKHVKLPRHSTLSFKRLYCRTTLLITIWENTSMFYCIFIVHFFFFKIYKLYVYCLILSLSTSHICYRLNTVGAHSLPCKFWMTLPPKTTHCNNHTQHT